MCPQIEVYETNKLFVEMGLGTLNLVTLDLSGCYLGSTGVIRLPDLANSVSIKKLALKDCKIGDTGCVQLGKFMGNVKQNLLLLDIRGNNITDVGIFSL